MSAAAGAGGVDLHVSVLPYRLRLGHAAREALPALAWPLLRLITHPERGVDGGFGDARPRRFFCYAETPNDVSLIVEDGLVTSLFSDAAAAVRDAVEWSAGADWRALQVALGTAGEDEQGGGGVVQKLSAPLAEAGVSVMYVSTWASDFVLIEAEEVGRALGVLRARFAVSVDGEDFGGAASPPPPPPAAPPAAAAALRPGPGVLPSFKFHSHTLFHLPLRLRVCLLAKGAVPAYTHFIQRLLLLERGTAPRLVSFCETEDEVSLLLPDSPELDEVARDTPGLSLSPNTWSCLQVGDSPLGFEESGVVASQAEVLCKRCRLPLFYLSTFSTDFTLVRTEDARRAVEALSEAFTVRVVDKVPVFGFVRVGDGGSAAATADDGAAGDSSPPAPCGPPAEGGECSTRFRVAEHPTRQ